MLKKIKFILRLDYFLYKWKKLNKHNQTIPINIFPIKLVKVGKYSYGPLNVYCFDDKNEKLIIGNFVSIASGVKFILGGNHGGDTISTFPFKVKYLGKKNEAWSKGAIIIEDDVWIGTNSLILSGVRVGKGSIIAAGSVITKDVEPYSVVGGNPAKLIKKRFDDRLIEKLINFNLLKLNEKYVKENIKKIYNNDSVIEIINELSNVNSNEPEI